MHIRTKALVLRESAYRESDKMLTLLTQEMGKLSACARGCRKKLSPLAASCQLFLWSDMVLEERHGRLTVLEGAVEREFRGMRRDVIRFALGCYLAEVTELLAVEGMPAPELLSLLLNSFHILDGASHTPMQVKTVFELKAMCLTGYEPLFRQCCQCGGPPTNPSYFHVREGVLRCNICQTRPEEGLPVSRGAYLAMCHVIDGHPRRIFSFRTEQLEQLAKLTESYLLQQLERNFQTLNFYWQCCRPVTEAQEEGLPQQKQK